MYEFFFLLAQLIGQLATLGDQFEGGGHHHALTLLAEHPSVSYTHLDVYKRQIMD